MQNSRYWHSFLSMVSEFTDELGKEGRILPIPKPKLMNMPSELAVNI